MGRVCYNKKSFYGNDKAITLRRKLWAGEELEAINFEHDKLNVISDEKLTAPPIYDEYPSGLKRSGLSYPKLLFEAFKNADEITLLLCAISKKKNL